jgi:hypothetical protein
MKLETPLLDKFMAMTAVSGTETHFTVKLPSGETASLDMNALFREIHMALHSLHHFMDPVSARLAGFPVVQQQVAAKDNPTAQAAIGHHEVIVPPFKAPELDEEPPPEKHEDKHHHSKAKKK